MVTPRRGALVNAYLPALQPVRRDGAVQGGEVEEHGLGVGVQAAAREHHHTILPDALQRRHLDRRDSVSIQPNSAASALPAAGGAPVQESQDCKTLVRSCHARAADATRPCEVDDRDRDHTVLALLPSTPWSLDKATSYAV